MSNIVLQESDRFIVTQEVVEGRKCVRKRAKTAFMQRKLADELAAYDVYGRMAARQDCPFKIAEVLDYSEDWILLSYIEGTPLQKLLSPDNKSMYLDRLAKIMAFTDNKFLITGYGKGLRQTKGQVAARMNKFLGMIDGPLGRLTSEYDDLIRELEIAKVAFVEGVESLDLAFTNPDLTPAHVIVDKNEFVIFDFENANLYRHRFSDVANVIARQWFYYGDSASAAGFLESFSKYSDIDQADFRSKLRTLLAQQSLGFTYELLTEPNQYHNTKLNIEPVYARRIIEMGEWARNLK